jgi:hypothetical protein
MRNFILIMALLLLGAVSMNAQIVTMDYQVVANNTITNNEADTSVVIPLEYGGSNTPDLTGVRPDSVRIEWRATATGDSIKTIYSWSVNFMGSGYSSYTAVDTVDAAGLGTYLLPRSAYAASDLLKVKLLALAAGNTLTSSNKLWMHVRCYYHIPAKDVR